MDEQNPPPLAVYPAPKKPKKESQGMSPLAQRALLLLGGIAIGGGLVMATIRMNRPEPVVRYVQPQVSTGAPPTNSVAQPEKEPHVGTPKVAAPAPGDEKWDPTKLPFNPFDAQLGSGMPSKEITGHIEPGPSVSGPPTANQTAPTTSEPPEQATPKGLLVNLRLDVSDPNAAISALQSIAQKAGGSAIQFDEHASKPDPEGAIVFVSTDKYEAVAKEIESVGTIVVSDKWTGSPLDRIDKIERAASDRLSDLRIQRQELLIKFFEDAPQVKHVDEDSGRISKCISALRARKPGPSTAVIKIKFLT